MTGRLEGKVAIVTGAGSVAPGWGNGKAIAVLFARQGARVLAVDIAEAAVAETVEMIRGEGHTAEGVVADVSDEAAVIGLVDGCCSRFGPVDVLVNNVGIYCFGGPTHVATADWDRTMAVNVRSMFLTCKHVLPIMEAQGRGAIVNISSVASIRAGRTAVAYAASKGAVNSLTQNVAVEYAGRGIRVNCVLPGVMETPMIFHGMDEAVAAAGGREAWLARRHAASPTGRMGDAWDVAYAALFLASDEAKYVNGHALVVDGGLSLRY